jgi:thiol:disulfide interchange protein DsbA
MVAAVVSLSTAQVHAQARAGATPPFEAGKHYTAISPAQPTSSDAGKVEVAEIFMFGCAGCYNFEPRLQSWLERKPDYVNVVRIPAPWNPVALVHARAYYTAEALGKAEAIAVDFFDEVHVKRNMLETEDKLAEFFARYGVDPAAFRTTFNSFAVNAKLKRANELIERYGVKSTPSVVVNGKYLTTGAQAGTYESWFAVIDDLAARENAGGGAAAAQ